MTKIGSHEKKNLLRAVIFGLLVVIFFVGIVFMYYRMVYEEKRSSIIKDGRMAAMYSADQFYQYLSPNIDLVKFTAYTLDEMIRDEKSDKEIQDFLVGQSTAIRNAVIENSTGLYGYINGRFFSGTNWIPPEDYVATARPWYTNAMAHPGELTILEPYVDVQSGNTMMAMGKTLCDDESVISVDISLDRMQKLTQEAVSSGDSDIEMILTSDGVVVTHSDIAEVGKYYGVDDGSLGAEIYKRLGRADEEYAEFVYEGKHYIIYDAVFQGDWHCVSVHDATTVFAGLNNILLVTLLVVIAIVIIIVIIFFISARRSIIAQRARASNEARSAFFSQMSHEIRTPINAILGMNEMIFRECRDKRILGYSGNIREAGKKLLDMVNDLLVFSENEKSDVAELAALQDLAEETLSDRMEVDDKQNARKKSFTAPEAVVLAVDDNQMNLEVLSSLLKRTAMAVELAESGDEALKLTAGKKYDLIFLDHMMPEKDGIETLKELRAAAGPNKETKVICVSANAIAGAREQYLEAGFDDYMSKPIDAGLLDGILIKYLPEDKLVYGKRDEDDMAETDAELPESLRKLTESSDIDIHAGIHNSGSVQAYIPLLKIFYNSMDDKVRELTDSYTQKDITNYIIRVHAMKSSARIIGAAELGEMAQDLEFAGKRGDEAFINAHHDAFISAYQSYREALAEIFETEEEEVSKPEADETLIEQVYEELKAAAEDMDCDRLQDILNEMDEYSFPEAERDRWRKIKEAVGNFDYEMIEKILET